MACTIIWNDKKRKFSNEEQFDNWIISHWNAIIEKCKSNNSLDEIFSISPEENTRINLNDLIKQTKTWRGTHRSTIGVTSLGGKLFNLKDPKQPAFNYTKKLEDVFSEAFKANYGDKDSDIYGKAVTNLFTDYGHWIHSIMQNAFSSKPINYKTIAKGKDAINYLVSDSAAKDAENVKNQIVEYINEKVNNGLGMKDWTKLHEAEIFLESKQFTETFKDMCDTAGINVDGLVGIVDMITINPSTGNLILFDYKSMKNKIEIDENKMNETALQLSIYKQILNNHGFTVDDMYIIPIEVDIAEENGIPKMFVNADNSRFFNITGVKFDPKQIKKVLKTNRYASEVASVFNYTPLVTNDDITKVKQLFKTAFYQLSEDSTVTLSDEDIKKYVEKAKTKDAKFVKVQHVSELPDALRKKAEAVGANYFVWRNKKIMGEGDGERAIFFKSNVGEEIDEFLAKTIKAISENKARLFLDFGNEIQNTISGNASRLDTLRSIANDMNRSNPNFIVNLFRKYIMDGWELQTNEALNAEGIYIFNKENRSEIINLSNQDLFKKIKLSKGSQTVLQNLIHDDEVGTDNTKTLNTLYGNILSLKSLMLLAQVPNLLKPGSKVQAIKIVNPWQQQIIDQSIGLYEETWKKFVFYWNDKSKVVKDVDGNPINRTKLNLLSSGANGTLLSSQLAYIYRANDVMNVFSSTNMDKFLTEAFENAMNMSDDRGYVEIFNLIKQLKKEAFQNGVDLRVINKLDFDNSWSLAYSLLCRALMSAAKWDIQIESDLATIMDKRLALDGVFARDPAFSKSAAMRILSSMMGAYREKIREVYNHEIIDWQRQLEKALKERGISEDTYDLRKFFKPWFEEDGSMRIKNPYTDPYFQDSTRKEEQKLALLLIKKFNQYRGLSEDAISDTSLEIPLLEEDFFKSIDNPNDAKEAVKRKANSIKDIVFNLLMGKEKSAAEIRGLENIDEDQIKDYYFVQDSEHRAKRLQENNENAFMHDLDTVFLYAASSNVTERVSRVFMNYFNGVRAILLASEHIDGMAERNINAAINAFIKKAVFEKSIVEVNHQNLMQFISAMKSVTSWTTLAWNVSGFTRENLASFFRTNASLTSANFGSHTVYDYEKAFNKNKNNSDIVYQANELFINKIKASDYSEMLGKLISDSISDKKIMRFNSQLNMIYGMTGVSARQLAEVQKKNRVDGVNWESGYWTTTWPDFIHRNAILQAYLKTIGALNAYSLDSNEELKYDMSKDTRYTLLFKYKFTQDLNDVEQSERKRYILELNAYKHSLNKWRRAQPDMVFGNLLPQALTVDEMNSIRNYADSLYGSYDADTKALMQSQTLGSLFFQYKNYSLQMLTGWYSDPGHVGNERLIQMMTNDGKKVWEVTNTKEEVNNGAPICELKIEDEVTDQMIRENRATPYLIDEEDPLTGKLNTIGNIVTATIKGDKDFLEHLMKSPIARYNMAMTLYDSFFMVLLSGLIALLYGKEKTNNMKDQEWWIRWTYAVANGMSSDGPLLQTLNSVIGDASMPMLSTLQTYYRNAYSIITGKRNAAYAMLNSFGATRLFTSLANNITD